MIIKVIVDCPFIPTHIKGKEIRKIFFGKVAIAY